MITDSAGCTGTGSLPGRLALSNASGAVIARDEAAAFTWQAGGCLIPFAFSGVPQLAGYGVRAPGLHSGTRALAAELEALSLKEMACAEGWAKITPGPPRPAPSSSGP